MLLAGSSTIELRDSLFSSLDDPIEIEHPYGTWPLACLFLAHVKSISEHPYRTFASVMLTKTRIVELNNGRGMPPPNEWWPPSPVAWCGVRLAGSF